MILNSFSGFHGFANPKRDNATKSNDAAIPADRYNANYLKNPHYMTTPYPNAEQPTLPVQGSDKYGWTCASVLADPATPHSQYNTTYLTNPTYTLKTPVPVLYTPQDGLKN